MGQISDSTGGSKTHCLVSATPDPIWPLAIPLHLTSLYQLYFRCSQLTWPIQTHDSPSSRSQVNFRFVRSIQIIRPNSDAPSNMSITCWFFLYDTEFSDLRPILNLKDRRLSAVCVCLFNVFAASVFVLTSFFFRPKPWDSKCNFATTPLNVCQNIFFLNTSKRISFSLLTFMGNIFNLCIFV
jgi:hypothetical protein